MTDYKSDIVLGQRYRDTQTGIEGTAVALGFYQYGCERATIECVIEHKIEEYTFDAPRLVNISTGERMGATDTGGPRSPIPRTGVH